jgi:hypothetical protein
VQAVPLNAVSPTHRPFAAQAKFSSGPFKMAQLRSLSRLLSFLQLDPTMHSLNPAPVSRQSPQMQSSSWLQRSPGMPGMHTWAAPDAPAL